METRFIEGLIGIGECNVTAKANSERALKWSVIM